VPKLKRRRARLVPLCVAAVAVFSLSALLVWLEGFQDGPGAVSHGPYAETGKAGKVASQIPLAAGIGLKGFDRVYFHEARAEIYAAYGKGSGTDFVPVTRVAMVAAAAGIVEAAHDVGRRTNIRESLVATTDRLILPALIGAPDDAGNWAATFTWR
jgi:hypothetical protein